jgi:hypothetical protein
MKTLKYYETTLSKPSYSMFVMFVCLNLLAHSSSPSNSSNIHFEFGSLHSTFVHVLEILKHDHVMKSTILWIPSAYVYSVCLITSIEISIFLICKLIHWTWVYYGFIFRIGCAKTCKELQSNILVWVLDSSQLIAWDAKEDSGHNCRKTYSHAQPVSSNAMIKP